MLMKMSSISTHLLNEVLVPGLERRRPGRVYQCLSVAGLKGFAFGKLTLANSGLNVLNGVGKLAI